MKRINGRIVPDPVARLSAGAKLGFRPQIFPIATPYGEYRIDNWDYYNGVLLHVYILEGRSVFVHGSAVLVAPGVALAARHVVEPFGSRFCKEGGAALTCGAITSSQNMMWHCHKISFVENSDLAVLILSYASELPSENIFSIAAITSRLPKIGEKVSMVGFIAAEDEFPFDPAECPIRGQVNVSVGKITARYPEGRDRGMIPWPVIEVASSASGGMSGGPVFDRYGLLVGIVSTSYTAEDHIGPSYISLLWPALTLPIDAEWPNGIHSPGRSLWELGPLCQIDRRDVFRRIGDTSFEYAIWEDTPNPA